MRSVKPAWAWCVGCVCVLMVCGSLWARGVTVTLRDGSKFSGELISESPNSVTIRLQEGVEKSWPRDQVRSLVQQPLTVEEKYRAERARLKDDDVNGRYELARWLYDQKTLPAYELALKELEAVLKLSPDHLQATFLKNAVTTRIKLEAKTPEPGAPEADPGQPDAADPGNPATPVLLTEDQINLLRVYEVDLRSRPRIFIPDKVIEDFLAAYRQDPLVEQYVGREGERRFKTLQPFQQLGVMFDVRAREFYPMVQVRDEPQTLKAYRQFVHNTYLITYCGRCHGEGKAPGFYVITDKRATETTAYTNLVILGMSESAGLPMIMQADGPRSPLVQYGLPALEAITPHPQVNGYRPFFSGQRDPRYTQMVQWIQSLSANTASPKDILPGYKPPATGARPDAAPLDN